MPANKDKANDSKKPEKELFEHPPPYRGGRRRSKVPARPNKPANLWSILKNSIGKDLSKVPVPVNFAEPLSLLQRLAEDFEYADLLDFAAKCKDPLEQLTYVAVFTISSYSTTSIRVGKPFNPLLGETYECDRNDLGWRALAEQVSHHPPVSAQFVEGRQWKCWQEFSMSTKFRGKYITVTPLGKSYCKFSNGSLFSWTKVTTNVNNVVFGKLWIDNVGDMEVINHTTGSKCVLAYIPFNSSNKNEQRRVTGEVKDSKGKIYWTIDGFWDRMIQICRTNDGACTETPLTVWKVNKFPDGFEKFYNFTHLACQLNEMEEGVAPTDSRLRPDQRLMEMGRWDDANDMKVKLEEKQRERRKHLERAKGSYGPVWFKLESDPISHTKMWSYKGGYWEAKAKNNWSMCPSIFEIDD